MRLSVLAMSLLYLVLFSGCATENYVKQQMAQLMPEIEAAKQDAREAKDLAQEAMTAASECGENSEIAMKRADAAAIRASDAAEKAETAAKKCVKTFNLLQKK